MKGTNKQRNKNNKTKKGKSREASIRKRTRVGEQGETLSSKGTGRT
jgi:hypothetical protein